MPGSLVSAKPLGMKILVMTGAGVSAESGIPTFRGTNGLWRTHRVEDVASPEAFRKDPRLVWDFYSERRAKARDAHPNKAHLALKVLQNTIGKNMLLVTQNVDGLHVKAGNTDIIELHGNLFESRCFNCGRPPFKDSKVYNEPPRCTMCYGYLRPNIVWFGEQISGFMEAVKFISDNYKDDLYYIAVGTSGTVYPAAALTRIAKDFQVPTWIINDETPGNVSEFTHFIQGKASEMLPKLLKDIVL